MSLPRRRRRRRLSIFLVLPVMACALPHAAHAGQVVEFPDSDSDSLRFTADPGRAEQPSCHRVSRWVDRDVHGFRPGS